MKRGEVIAALREIQINNAHARGWLDASDASMAKLIERLSAPGEQRQAEPEPPASDFVVQETDGRDERPKRTGKVEFEGDPLAVSVANAITPKQLGMIRALAREAGVDYEAECAAQLDCKPEDLSKRAASAFIDYLQVIKDEGAEFRKVG